MSSSDPGLFDVVIAGSGPAGLAAAIASGESGAKTLLLERLDQPGRKLLASGGGRCNIGNTLPLEKFMARFGRDGRFMADAFKAAPPYWARDFLAARNIKCEAEDGLHFFPLEGGAAAILDAFLSGMKELGVELRCGVELEEIEKKGALFELKTSKGTLRTKSVLLAAGGTAWPSLGGTDKGLELARSLGHKINTPLPAMAPVVVAESWVGGLSGVSLPDAKLELPDAGRDKSRASAQGELLFTHDGLSGPAALDISSEISAAIEKTGGPVRFTLSINPKRDMKAWRSEMDFWRKFEPKRLVRTALAKAAPRSLAETLYSLAGCPDVACCELKAQDRDVLAGLLAATPLTATGCGPMSRSMAMRGGVSLKEVSPRDLQSRLTPGVFFAGEILDLDGPCGGYNIQWALSSGRLAGLSAAALAKKED